MQLSLMQREHHRDRPRGRLPAEAQMHRPAMLNRDVKTSVLPRRCYPTVRVCRHRKFWILPSLFAVLIKVKPIVRQRGSIR